MLKTFPRPKTATAGRRLCSNAAISASPISRAPAKFPAVVDFNLKLMPGEAHGVVGESGCGKSTVALAIMQYLGKNGRIVGGEILFEGRDMTTMSEEELRQIRGSKIAMVYQEPMASLNPSMTIGDQLAEVPIYPRGHLQGGRAGARRARYSRACACPTRRASWAPTRTRSPAASSSAW